MFRRILTLLLITTLMFTMTTGVFAEDIDETPGFISITGTYLLDGDINWKIHAGNTETGAEQKTVITGIGVVDKTVSANISLGKLTVTESTYLESVKNLKMISAIQLGFSPVDATYEHDQVYAWYIAPADGEFGMVEYSYVATDSAKNLDDDGKEVYIDSFIIDYESALSRGLFARYISMSSETAQASYVDDMTVKGAVSITEVFELLDVIRPFKSPRGWYDLF